MGKATVYTIDDNNEIVAQFTMDYNDAIGLYWRRRDEKGRYHIVPEGIACPYKKKKKHLLNIKRNQTHQEV